MNNLIICNMMYYTVNMNMCMYVYIYIYIYILVTNEKVRMTRVRSSTCAKMPSRPPASSRSLIAKYLARGAKFKVTFKKLQLVKLQLSPYMNVRSGPGHRAAPARADAARARAPDVRDVDLRVIKFKLVVFC